MEEFSGHFNDISPEIFRHIDDPYTFGSVSLVSKQWNKQVCKQFSEPKKTLSNKLIQLFYTFPAWQPRIIYEMSSSSQFRWWFFQENIVQDWNYDKISELKPRWDIIFENVYQSWNWVKLSKKATWEVVMSNSCAPWSWYQILMWCPKEHIETVMEQFETSQREETSYSQYIRNFGDPLTPKRNPGFALSHNPNIDVKYILEHNYKWDWNIISSWMPYSEVLEYPDLPWKYEYMGENVSSERWGTRTDWTWNNLNVTWDSPKKIRELSSIYAIANRHKVGLAQLYEHPELVKTNNVDDAAREKFVLEVGFNVYDITEKFRWEFIVSNLYLHWNRQIFPSLWTRTVIDSELKSSKKLKDYELYGLANNKNLAVRDILDRPELQRFFSAIIHNFAERRNFISKI